MSEQISDDDEDEGVLDIDDPLVPEEIRLHGARFRNPARYAISQGRDWWLFGENGELLDIAWLKY